MLETRLKTKLEEAQDHPRIKAGDSAPTPELIPGEQKEATEYGANARTEKDETSNTLNFSDYSNETLVALAMHPDTEEPEWVNACIEINRRNIKLPCPPPKRHSKLERRRRIFLLAGAFTLLGILSASVYQYYWGPKIESDIRAKSNYSNEPYHLMAANWHAYELKEKVRLKLAEAINARSWTNGAAAKYLNVNADQIKALRDGQPNDLNLVDEIKLLYALDKSVDINIADSLYERSKETKTSDQEIQAAVDIYTRAIAANPDDETNYYKRGCKYEELGQKELAIADYSKCLELNPMHSGALNNRSMVHWVMNHLDLSLADCNEMIRKFPGQNHFSNRGLVYASMEQNQKAIADFSLAAKLEPQRPGPYFNRANVYKKIGNFKEAIADYERTLKADPTYTPARKKVAELKQKS